MHKSTGSPLLAHMTRLYGPRTAQELVALWDEFGLDEAARNELVAEWLADPIPLLDEAAWDELVAECPGESASPTCSAPTLDDLIAALDSHLETSGKAVRYMRESGMNPVEAQREAVTSLLYLPAAGEVRPGHQPGVFKLVRELEDGWHRLQNIDVDFFRWPGDSKPEGYPELGLKTVRWTRKRIGQSINRDYAVRIACHWLADWSGSVDVEDLRDWLVASFFTIAGGHQPPLVNGDTYRFIDRNTKLRAVWLDENVVGRCIEKAASSNVHHEALDKAGELIRRRNPRRLGGALSGWIAESLPRCQKRPAGKNALRDRAIVAAIERLEAEGMSATRGVGSKTYSACDAIVEATNGRVTFAMAEWVWKKWKRQQREAASLACRSRA